MRNFRRQFLEREKIKGYLNISRKAGYLIIGGETLDDYTKKLFLVLLWLFIIFQLSVMKKFKCRARMKEFYSELTRFSY